MTVPDNNDYIVSGQIRTWAELVKAIIRENTKVGEMFTRQDFIKEHLQELILLLSCKGVTPAQTLSRVLQEIRKEGYIRFLCDEKGTEEHKGEYRVIRPIPEIEVDNYKWKGERMIARILRDILEVEDIQPLFTGKKGREKLLKIFKYHEAILKKFGFMCQVTIPGMIWKGELRYDFYLEIFDFKGGKHKCAIEFHGKQHDEPVEIFGGIRGYEDTKARDLAKAKFSYANNIKVLYIRTMNYEEAEKFQKLRNITRTNFERIMKPNKYKEYIIINYNIFYLLTG
jgi:hypothetical protein